MCLAFSFAPSLSVLVYKGDKERRTEIQQEANSQDFHVLLTTYEVGGYYVKTKQDKVSPLLKLIYIYIYFFFYLLFPAVSQRCFILETVSLYLFLIYINYSGSNVL